ncbi:AAA family ATPase [Neptunomonas concharum]|uniref:AAA domain-containing protein n=1 Tax=Neptunomonas concharum TaxID=1031538 RepID=A0A5P1R9A1_9GAMM|nr:AAA family ATPase [Neptunomonas concharum]QEQ96200.1 AAA domain-containing protein [Neptunomonas concharum]
MRDKVEQAIASMSSVVMGKESSVKLAVACLLARGHLLIEDLPGMGKTTLAHTLAHVFDLDYRRVQFTSDMLPADILGGAIFDQKEGLFQFHPGPVFTQLLLADEINRSTPKTQSALLEAMEERQVSSEGVTRKLPEPFFVIATQNPISQYGTFPLPESQLDRFLMRISIGYPDQETERALLKHGDTRHDIANLTVCMNSQELLSVQAVCDEILVSDAVIDYVQRLSQASRDADEIELGLSPRGALALLQAAKAWAYLENRDYVVPDDIQHVFPQVVKHRLLLKTERDRSVDPITMLLQRVDMLSVL